MLYSEKNLDLNFFFNKYTEDLTSIIKEKNTLFETFREKEELFFREYEDAVSDLNKTTSQMNLNLFTNIRDRVYTILLHGFDPGNMKESIEKVESMNYYLKEKEKEFKALAEIQNFIKNKWTAFLEKRKLIEKDALFKNEVSLKIENMKNLFANANIEELGRLEQSSEELKQEVLRLIDTFEYLFFIKEKYVYVGKEAKEIEEQINSFLEIEFFENSLIDILKKKDSLKERVDEIKEKETKYVRKKFNIVKLSNKNKKEVYFYSIRINENFILGTRTIDNINEEAFIIEDTEKYIYIDSYPEKGIFDAVEIREEIDISESQFEAMERVDKETTGLFFGFISMTAIATLLSLFSVIDTFSLIIVFLISLFGFKFLFKNKINKINKELNVDNAFFFIPVSYYIVNEGDEHFDYKSLCFLILINAEKIFLGEKRNG